MMAWTAVVLTVLAGIPAAIVGCFLLLQFDQCSAVFCSGGFRALVAIATIALLLPIVLFWTRFLQRIVSYRDANDVSESG
jgi:ABC-type phosphate transport system permease subunit